jgi:hypothetical protein
MDTVNKLLVVLLTTPSGKDRTSKTGVLLALMEKFPNLTQDWLNPLYTSLERAGFIEHNIGEYWLTDKGLEKAAILLELMEGLPNAQV